MDGRVGKKIEALAPSMCVYLYSVYLYGRFCSRGAAVPGLFPIPTNRERTGNVGKYPRIKGHFIQTIYNIH